MDQTALAKSKQADLDAKAKVDPITDKMKVLAIPENDENLNNQATQGLDYQEEPACANCSA